MEYTLSNRADRSVEPFRDVLFKIRRALGTTAFGIDEFRMPADFEGPEHDEVETGHEEVAKPKPKPEYDGRAFL